MRPSLSDRTPLGALVCLMIVAGSSTSPAVAGAGAPPAQSAPAAPPRTPVAIINGKEVAVPDLPMGDAATIERILDEGKNRNHVMDHMTYIATKIGPRLTGSTRATTANTWCMEQYKAWGLDNPHLEQWGTMPVGFDRGPSTGKLVLRREKKNEDGTTAVNFDHVRDLNLSTLSWTSGTSGPVRGQIIKEPRDEAEYAAVKDKAKGAWVLLDAPPPSGGGRRGIRGGLGEYYTRAKEARKKVAAGTKPEEIGLPERLLFDGAVGFVATTRDERVWTGACPGWRELDPENIPADLGIIVRGSDYDAINSRLYDSEPVELEVDLQHTLVKGPVPMYNTVAEIKGTEKPEEIVFISAHLDSWDGPGSQGTLDNGTGSAVTLEAARILKAVNAKPKRTIRFVNWTGEEQGLLGSRAYVAAHKDEMSGVSACFVDDGGTNYEGGVPAASQMVPMLAAATAPVNNVFWSQTDNKFLNVNIRDTGAKIDTHGSSDHAAFNAVGVPGFFWDETGRSDYGLGWHTQNDKIELAIPEYLVQSSTCAAITAYNLACAPDLLPRVVKEEKKPEPEAKPEPKAETKAEEKPKPDAPK